MKCNICKSELKNQYTLKTHQEKNKKCIRIQLQTRENQEKFEKWITLQSELKDKDKALQSELKDKDKALKAKDKALKEKDKHILKLEEQIKELQNNIKDISIKSVSRATTKNTQINNYIQNLRPITEEQLLDNVQYLSIDHILRGPEGYAEYALEYPLKDSMICVDYARRKVKFKDKDGNVITDPEMSNLAEKFFNSIKDKNKELILEYGDKLKENFGNEVDIIVKILDYKLAVDNGSVGDRTEFHSDFVKQMCCKTMKDE
jgi:DNA repair exonuclease SbcCD ATPase subunit